jgi:hypothetical protein
MALETLEGFRSLQTHHCVTGSLRHVYLHNRHDASEEMLLGIGAGVSFSTWHFKGQTPFMGGRGNVERPGVEGLVKTAGRRTGVAVEVHTTSSVRKARRALVESLDAGQPLMIQCDMGFLPYFDFGDVDYHFGWHVVVVCGFDAETEQALIADRDGLHPVPLEALEQARGSTHKPFPPGNKWWTFDFCQMRPPTAGEVRRAIEEQAASMLEPPIRNIGVEGIRKVAKQALKWPDLLSEKELRLTLFNSFVFIDATGGSGGGLFRYMLSRFLREAAGVTGEPRLDESAAQFHRIGDRWQEVAEVFKRGYESEAPAGVLPETTAPLIEIADLEEAAWTRLRQIVTR